jgi:asparagine synthase (glutamine-hydrolysing)
MCGISGFFDPGRIFSREDLQAFNHTLKHRGPDDDGIFFEPGIGLGNTRLSVIDLSEKGHQPMHSADGRFTLVYNGEVYNYVELRQELEQKTGKKFQSDSDTEVILEGFVLYGTAFFEKLNGMFAVAIFDRQEKKLVIARDRIGIKPLYYYFDGNGLLAFSSEIHSFKFLKKIPIEINRGVIPVFLHLGFIPAPWSIYRNIFKLKPGYMIEVDGKNLNKRAYYQLRSQFQDSPLKDEKTALNRLEEIVTDSVRIQMRSDVPFGIFLSGGIDSSLLTALASKISPNAVNTFSIGFSEKKFDETPYARKVAGHLKTNHHDFILSQDDAVELLDKMVDTYGEPFADSSAIPTLLVSEQARKYVKVVLTGEGADELFYGYGSYRWATRLDSFLFSAGRGVIKTLLSLAPGSRYHRVAELLDYGTDDFLPAHLFSQEQYFFSDNELKSISRDHIRINAGFFRPYLTALDTISRKFSASEKQALFDLLFYLPDDLLVKVDRASMRYGLESRVPYLDHRLVEFSLNLDQGLKTKNKTDKYILKQLLYRHLPASYFNRPKQGFSIPLNSWLSGKWEVYISRYLNKELIAEAGFVNYPEVENLIRRYQHPGNEYLYKRIWALVILHKWYIKNR